MVAISSANTFIGKGVEKFSQNKNAKCNAALGGVFCLLDFLTVPGAFKLKYNKNGEKIEGLNWECGLKELGKSAIKCLGYIAAPAAILGLASGSGIIIAGLAGAAAFGSTFLLSSLFDKLLPEEKQIVAEACREKGIDINQKIDQLV